MYLDGFYGPGRYVGEEDGYLIIALKEAIKHYSLTCDRKGLCD
jgi:hypothetical protein